MKSSFGRLSKKFHTSFALAALLSCSFMSGTGAVDARGVMKKQVSPTVSRAVINGKEYSIVKTVVNSSPDRVWSIIADHNNLDRVFTQMKKSKVVKDLGNVKYVKHTVTPSGPVGSFSYVVRVSENAPRKMEWKRVSGAFKDVSGFWKLEPLDGGRTTRVTYASYVDGGFFLPSPIIKRQCRIDMPVVISQLKNKVEHKMQIAGNHQGSSM